MMSSKQPVKIELQHAADVLERMTVTRTIDLGDALIALGKHPDSDSRIAVVTTMSGQAAILFG